MENYLRSYVEQNWLVKGCVSLDFICHLFQAIWFHLIIDYDPRSLLRFRWRNNLTIIIVITIMFEQYI